MLDSFLFGRTQNGLPIPAYRFGTQGPQILIMGGVHGDEPEGVVTTYGLLGSFSFKYDLKIRVMLIPSLNLDGLLLRTRGNASGVDLNRNMPTNDWSPEAREPKYYPGPYPNSERETQAIMRQLDEEQTKFIISLHSWQPLLNVNGPCQRQAEVIARTTGYKIVDDVGYPTPGSLGTYCGLERGLPTLTYEIERGLEPKKILAIHVPAILQCLKETEGDFK